MNISDPSIEEEFKSFIEQKMNKAKADLERYTAFLSGDKETEQKKQIERFVPPVEDFLIINTPKVDETILSKNEIVSAVKYILKDKAFLSHVIIFDKLKSKGVKWHDLQMLEMNNALNSEIAKNNSEIKRFMFGEKMFTYALMDTPIPNKEIIFYNADAKNGKVMFNNMKKTVIKTAKTFNRAFQPNEVYNILIKDMYYMKAQHKKDFKDAISTCLGQLAKNGILSCVGDRGNKFYTVI